MNGGCDCGSSGRIAAGEVCPVCDATGSTHGLWTHLTQDHGWDEDRIRDRLGPHPYAADDRR